MSINNNILAALSVRMTTDASKFNQGMDKAAKKFNVVELGAKKLKGAILGAFSIGTILAIERTARAAAEYADKIDKTAIRTGLARDNLQELAFVADQAGVSYETIEQAVTRLTRAMGDAENGSVRQVKAFNQLGIEIRDTDGNMRHMREIFPEVISKLNGIRNETERNALAMEFFGRGALNLVPLLANLGDEGIEELSKQAHDLNLVLGDEGIASLVEYKDKMSQLKMQFQAMGREYMVDFADVMTESVIPALQEGAMTAANFKEIFKTAKSAIQDDESFWHDLFEGLKQANPFYWAIQYGKEAIDWLGGMAREHNEAAEAVDKNKDALEEEGDDGVAPLIPLFDDLNEKLAAQKKIIAEALPGEYKKVAAANALAKAYEEQLKWLRQLQPEDLKRADTSEMYYALPYDAHKIDQPAKEILPIPSSYWEEQLERSQAAVERFVASYQEQMAEIAMVNATIEHGVEDMAMSFAEHLGRVMAGAEKFNLENAILVPMANMISQLGKMLITTAVGIKAFNTSLKTLNPYIVGAAGIALVALGSAIKAGIQSIPDMAGGGISLPSSSADVNPESNYLTRLYGERQQIDIKVVGVLQGDDIYLANQRAAERWEQGT